MMKQLRNILTRLIKHLININTEASSKSKLNVLFINYNYNCPNYKIVFI